MSKEALQVDQEYLVPDVEKRWQDFLVGVLAHTVDLCMWLAAQSAGRCRDAYPRTLHRRLLNAAVAWQWVFSEPDCDLPLAEVCLFLGLNRSSVRARILSACSPPPDINQVVAKILLECGEDNGKPKRKTAAARRVGATDWARLRDFRRKHPAGAGIEDFCRIALGGIEDADPCGRGAGGAARGRTEERRGGCAVRLPGRTVRGSGVRRDGRTGG